MSISLQAVSNNNNGDGRLTAKVDWLGLRVGGHPALSLHSSSETGELLKRLVMMIAPQTLS